MDLAIVAALLMLTAIPFAQVVRFDFVRLDDPGYVSESALVQRGLNPFALLDALGFYMDNWHPLVWWSLMLDFQLYGLHPAGYHLENLVWHLANVGLLFAALKSLTGDRWRSTFVAAVFGVHPLHVESVAWVTERKDVLSGFWWMAGLWAYARYARSGTTRDWKLVTVALVLGLMSKAIVVTLPCVFLLLDLWPLNRWRDPHTGHITTGRLWRLMVEKRLWFVLVVVTCGLTVLAQQSPVDNASDWPMTLRLANSTLSAVRYLGQTFWPVRMCVMYPMNPPETLWPVAAAAMCLLAITAAAIWFAPRCPALLVGWLWYLGVLAPVIGILQVGSQSMADRYMYLPQIGVSIAMAWAIPSPRATGMMRLYAVAAGIVLLALMARCMQQTAVWHDSKSLFTQALAVDPTNDTACMQVAYFEFREGSTSQGLDHMHAALKYRRQRWAARYRYGRPDPARLTRANQQWADMYFTLGRQEVEEGRRSNAIADFREAVSLDGQRHDARLELGQQLLETSKIQEGLRELRTIITQQPEGDIAKEARSLIERYDRATDRVP